MLSFVRRHPKTIIFILISAAVTALFLHDFRKWSAPHVALEDLPLYEDVDMREKGLISANTICRIDENREPGKVYSFHKIECQDGQTGYLFVLDRDLFKPA